jgi:hypothetical protein
LRETKKEVSALRLTSICFFDSRLTVSASALLALTTAAALTALSPTGFFAALTTALTAAGLFAALLTALAILLVLHSVFWHCFPPCSK